jgi:hypothetical protein
MGLLNWILGSDNDDNSDEGLDDTAKAHIENPSESNILRDPEELEGKVDTPNRIRIIHEHYSDVSEPEAEVITEVLKENTETYDLQKHEAKTRIVESTGLDRERVNEIFWTESGSVQKCNNLFTNEGGSVSLLHEWDVADPPCSPICEEVAAKTQERGGVSLEELQSLLREHAEKYADEGGTPDRVAHWVPHLKCSATTRTIIDD